MTLRLGVALVVGFGLLYLGAVYQREQHRTAVARRAHAALLAEFERAAAVIGEQLVPVFKALSMTVAEMGTALEAMFAALGEAPDAQRVEFHDDEPVDLDAEIRAILEEYP